MAGYFGNIPTPQATQTRDTFTATSGQTSFATSGYTVGMLDVYLNGIKLASADFTATNGSDVVLASGASADDILEVVSFSTFDSASGAFSVDLKSDKLLNKSGDQDSGINLATNDTIKFDIAGSTKWTMNSSGNLFPAATSQGICFGVTSDTASNRLDDYEEGTFTPTLSNGATSISYSVQVGYYVKIGSIVNFGIDLNMTAATASSNPVQVGPLPFTNNPSNNQYYSAALISYTAGFIDGPDRGFWHISQNSTVIGLFNYAGNTVAGNATGIDVSNRLILTGTYNTL